MRACIVVPPSPFLDDDHVFPHLGPYYIKRYVEEHSEHTVDVLIGNPWLGRLWEYHVVGVSSTTPQYYVGALDILGVTLTSPDQTVVLGGPHARYYEVEDGWDYVVRGDGCQSFLNILDGKEPGGGPDDPDQLPHRDSSFQDYVYHLDGRPTTAIMTSRGCSHTCAFCEHAGSSLRLKSPEAVVREIGECVNLGFGGIMFYDDLFCLNRRRVKDLCNVIQPFGIVFRCFAHARNFTEEMAGWLSEAGCVEIGFGAESGAQEILDTVDKKTDATANWRLVEKAHKYGIRVKAFLMLGLPGESDETAQQTENFVLTSGVDDFDITIYYPYRGTHIAEHPEQYDIRICDIPSEGWYKGCHGAAECVVETSHLTREEIIAWRDRIYSHRKN